MQNSIPPKKQNQEILPSTPPKKKLFSDHPEVDKEIDREIFMVRHGRLIRILLLVFIFLVIVGGGGYISYKLLVPPPECRFDDDCESGYFCHDNNCEPIPVEKPPEDLAIIVENTEAFPSVDGKVDFFAAVRNPDSRWGLAEMGYTFIGKDVAGNEVSRYSGLSYILPGEEKYLVAVGTPTTTSAQSVEVILEPHSWVKSPQLLAPNIEVKNLVFSEESEIGQARLDGRLINSSKYNFEEVEVAALLKDAAGMPVGVNYTTLNALIAGEERDFRLLWFSPIVGDVAASDVKVRANIYDSSNFLQQMKSEPELFQLYEEPDNY
jgi:hypothetical protein